VVYYNFMARSLDSSSVGFRRQFPRQGTAGFSLVEILCVLAIMSILAASSWSSVAGLLMGNQLTNNAYELRGLFQQAKMEASAQNTYVWVGFYSYKVNGAPTLAVATVSSKGGLVTDVNNPNNYQTLVKNVIMKNVVLDTTKNYLNLPGIDVTDNNDVVSLSGQATGQTFTANVPGQGIVTFGDVVAFAPDGGVNLPQSNGTLALYPCVGVGLDASPAGSVHTAAVQIHGLSGQVSVFQQ